MEEPQPSKLDRIKQFVRENQGAITFGAGVGVGAIVVSQFPGFFLKPSSYNPAQPIPSLIWNEEQIKRRLASGMLFDLFIRDKQLYGEFVDFANRDPEELFEVFNQLK